MSILSQAKKLAKENKSIENIKQARRKQAKEAKKQQDDRKLVLKALKEIDGKDGFFLHKEDGNFGEIVSIHKAEEGYDSEYIGTVCIQYETYLWRGSDEAREQQVTDTYLVLKQDVNEDESLICCTVKWDGGIEKAIKEFNGLLAGVLSKYF